MVCCGGETDRLLARLTRPHRLCCGLRALHLPLLLEGEFRFLLDVDLLWRFPRHGDARFPSSAGVFRPDGPACAMGVVIQRSGLPPSRVGSQPSASHLDHGAGATRGEGCATSASEAARAAAVRRRRVSTRCTVREVAVAGVVVSMRAPFVERCVRGSDIGVRADVADRSAGDVRPAQGDAAV